MCFVWLGCGYVVYGGFGLAGWDLACSLRMVWLAWLRMFGTWLFWFLAFFDFHFLNFGLSVGSYSGVLPASTLLLFFSFSGFRVGVSF